MYYYLQQALPRVLIHLTRAVEKKWNLRVRFSPLLRRTASIRRGLTKTVSRLRFSGQDQNKKFLLLNVQFAAFVFCFLQRNLFQEWETVFVSVLPQHFIPLHYVRRRFPSVSALWFRCCRKILFVNQKLTFDERISCITRHDDFSPRIHRAVYCKLPLSSEIAKAEAIVAIVEPLKPNRKRVSFQSDLR